MKTQCPHCQKVFPVPDVYKGRRINCLSCHKDLLAEPITETAKSKVSEQPVPQIIVSRRQVVTVKGKVSEQPASPSSNGNLWILAIIIGAGLALVITFAFVAQKIVAQKRSQQKIQSAEKELAFQKEKEETRKAEFAELLRIHEEEKRAAEERRIQERGEERYRNMTDLLAAKGSEENAMMMGLLQSIMQNKQKTYLPERAGPPLSIVELLRPSHLDESGNKGIVSGGRVIVARITNDFDGLKHGNIYKLDNSQIWEQTDFYIHTRIAIMPSVVIWRDGAVYKMIVDGIDRAVAVRQLK